MCMARPIKPVETAAAKVVLSDPLNQMQEDARPGRIIFGR